MSKGFLFSAIVAGAVVLMSAGAPANAADSACKGMAQTKCEGASSCSWVKGYKTKEGKNVAAYCRNKGKGAAASEKAKDAKKTVSKKADAVKKADKSATKPKTPKTN